MWQPYPTIFQLAERFYDPQSGRVLRDFLENDIQPNGRLPGPLFGGQARVQDEPGNVKRPRSRVGRDRVRSESRLAPPAQLRQRHRVPRASAQIDDSRLVDVDGAGEVVEIEVLGASAGVKLDDLVDRFQLWDLKPFLEEVVEATTIRDAQRYLGERSFDLLVRYPSAIGRPRRGRAMFPDADLLHIRGNAASYYDRLPSARKVRAVAMASSSRGPAT